MPPAAFAAVICSARSDFNVVSYGRWFGDRNTVLSQTLEMELCSLANQALGFGEDRLTRSARLGTVVALYDDSSQVPCA